MKPPWLTLAPIFLSPNIWGDSKKLETGTFRSSCLGCVLGWFSKRSRTNRIYLLPTHLPTYLSNKVYYRELAHVVLKLKCRTTSHMQAGEPESQWHGLKAWKPRRQWYGFWSESGCQRTRNMERWDGLNLEAHHRSCDDDFNSPARFLFCSGPNYLDSTHPHLGRVIYLLTPPVPTWISFWKHWEIIINQISGACCRPVQWTH